MQKTIIIIGIAIVVIGLLWPWLSKLPLGRLPGDIFIQKENSTFVFPITTMIVISLILTVLVNWFKK